MQRLWGPFLQANWGRVWVAVFPRFFGYNFLICSSVCLQLWQQASSEAGAIWHRHWSDFAIRKSCSAPSLEGSWAGSGPMAPGLQRSSCWSRYSWRSNSVSHLLWANQVISGKGALGILWFSSLSLQLEKLACFVLEQVSVLLVGACQKDRVSSSLVAGHCSCMVNLASVQIEPNFSPCSLFA